MSPSTTTRSTTRRSTTIADRDSLDDAPLDDDPLDRDSLDDDSLDDDPLDHDSLDDAPLDDEPAHDAAFEDSPSQSADEPDYATAAPVADEAETVRSTYATNPRRGRSAVPRPAATDGPPAAASDDTEPAPPVAPPAAAPPRDLVAAPAEVEPPTVPIAPVRERFVPSPVAYAPPPARRFDPGRWLRNLAGVDDRLLRQVWFERARHTALGGIILGTALIAGFSMWMAINESLGYASVITFIPALIWFIFIISLDRALVSTMVGQGRRWGAFLMRLALSIMFGFIIAEPLTIRIFQTAIEQHIQDERSAAAGYAAQRAADLQHQRHRDRCCPAAGELRRTYRLTFEKSPIALEQQLAAKQADATTLAATVDADQKELARLTDLARKECAGTKGPGLTGQRGYGPDCIDRNKDVATFESTHPIKANTDSLAALRTDITALSAQISAAQASFESDSAKLVDQRVAGGAKDHQGSIGLLERMGALHELAATTWGLFFGTWAVRIFFILADCLPVVVKFSSGLSQLRPDRGGPAANAVRRYDQDLEILDGEADTHVRKYKSDLETEVQEHRAGNVLRRDEAVSRVASSIPRSGARC